MGHYIQLRREGVKPSGMVFIPFLGAAVATRSLGGSALAEARVGLAGPILGSIACLIPAGLWIATGEEFWQALAFTGFFLNLFNLIPVVPFDGGRAMAAMTPWMWFVGLGAMAALLLVAPNPFVLLFLVLGALHDLPALEEPQGGRGGQRRLLPRQARAPARGRHRLRGPARAARRRDGPDAPRAHS